MHRLTSNDSWHLLSSVIQDNRPAGDNLVELLAATCADGIGVIARWTRREGGGWDVEAMDTEGEEGMQPVTDFHEGEPVPATPPLGHVLTERADDSALIEPPAESDPRSATWPQRVMTRGEARKLGLLS